MEAAAAAADGLGVDENDNVIGLVEGVKADASGVHTSESAGVLEETGDRLIAACISGDAHDVLSLLVKGKSA